MKSVRQSVEQSPSPDTAVTVRWAQRIGHPILHVIKFCEKK